MNIPLMSGRVKQYARELFRDKNSMENMPFGGLSYRLRGVVYLFLFGVSAAALRYEYVDFRMGCFVFEATHA